MEKRWCKRIPASATVEVYHNGKRVSKCLVKDISLCGMCLISGPLVFYKNTELEIKFPDGKLEPENVDHIKAVVVRSSNHDMGLMFTPTEPESLRSIIKTIGKDYQRISMSAG